jgi:ATP-binding cassette subfamily F protein 3
MVRLAREKAAADAWLAGADAYIDANRDRLKETIARQGDVASRLARLEAEWLELAEAIERIDAGGT